MYTDRSPKSGKRSEGVSPERVEEIRALHESGVLFEHVQRLFDGRLGPLPSHLPSFAEEEDDEEDDPAGT
jgi:hypothetical protein